MRVYQGKSVFGGIAIGKIHVYRKGEQKVTRSRIADVEAELARFWKARDTAIEQLKGLYAKAVKEVGESGAAIFEIHQIMLTDDDFLESIENMIRTQQVNAEYAVAVTGDNFSGMFAAMEDEYMRGRAADVKDISERLLTILIGDDSGQTAMEEPVILVAEDLAPSETVQLDKEKILSFVTLHGSVNSHTAILARTMAIPALVGTQLPVGLFGKESEAFEERVGKEGIGKKGTDRDTGCQLNGMLAVVDGNQGLIYVDPDEQTLKEMRRKQEQERERKELLQTLKGKESATKDGQPMLLYANIGNSRDLAMVLQNDAEGIGLFRSEFLYLGKESYPTEEEQFRVYKKVAETMAGKRVIIRTLDIGADKQADYFHLNAEENPAMGLRGIRICLTRPDVFRTQLRALFRASAYGKIAIMYPMITSVREVRQIRELVESVKKELDCEHICYGQVEQGIMIETPAAAIISDLLAKEVDFFSIGTNDLTQYLLAIDRQNEALDSFYDPFHPALLRMIYQTVQNAHKAGIWCGICGELGAETKLTKLFLAMGIDELSVSPGAILPLRRMIRDTDAAMEKTEQLKQWLGEDSVGI
ncbi:MAG: phosphoenolpyruvate--protein phosphotransferase [Lachnospiraceae bacterium]|nr:phosphoenolpyruvate--protein phosphotransferase [Lachnospiraceae bacterium]